MTRLNLEKKNEKKNEILLKKTRFHSMTRFVVTLSSYTMRTNIEKDEKIKQNDDDDDEKKLKGTKKKERRSDKWPVSVYK